MTNDNNVIYNDITDGKKERTQVFVLITFILFWRISEAAARVRYSPLSSFPSVTRRNL